MPAVTPSLTDRYVAAVIRGLPADQQEDVARELRTTIEDTIDARRPGTDELEAERAALESLGDPTRLAADYANTPGYLIGPAVYVDYLRLLKLLLTIVPAIVAVSSAAVTLAQSDANVASVLAAFISSGLQAALQVAFWVTLSYALVERYGDPAARASRRAWTVDRLDELAPAREFTMVETAVGIAFYGVLAAVLLAVPASPTFTTTDGRQMDIFDAGLWPGWIRYFVLVLVATMVFEVIKYRRGRWTYRLAWINVGLNVAFAVPALVLLLTDRLLDPAGMAAASTQLGWLSVNVSTVVVALVIVVAVAFDIVDSFRKAARPARVAG